MSLVDQGRGHGVGHHDSFDPGEKKLSVPGWLGSSRADQQFWPCIDWIKRIRRLATQVARGRCIEGAELSNLEPQAEEPRDANLSPDARCIPPRAGSSLTASRAACAAGRQPHRLHAHSHDRSGPVRPGNYKQSA